MVDKAKENIYNKQPVWLKELFSRIREEGKESMVLEPGKRASSTIDGEKEGTDSRHRGRLLTIIKKKENKFGLRVIVTKKLGKAVIRNRLRRRAKEAFRLIFGTLKPTSDFILIPRAALLKAPFEEIKEEIKEAIGHC